MNRGIYVIQVISNVLNHFLYYFECHNFICHILQYVVTIYAMYRMILQEYICDSTDFA